MAKLAVALIIPDCHRPYHHERAYNLMLSIACDIRPQEIVLLGDYADFYFASGHGAKHPKILNSTIEEVESVNTGLDELDKLFPKAKKRFLEGNHCYRLERFIQNKCPELFGYVDVQHLFKIQKRPGWSWHAYLPSQRIQVLGSKLYARHEPAGASAKLTASRALCSLVYGHIHRIEESHIVGLDGTNHVAFSIGWLGDKRKNEIFGYVKNYQQWQLGFGLVWVDISTGLFHHHKVHIIERAGKLSCVVNGKLYKG